jgi:hypothetical protein
VILGGIVLIVGCSALFAVGLDEAEKEEAKNAITPAEFRSVQQGTSQSAVERRFGEPQDSQEFEQEIPEIQDQPERSSCIYYPEKDKELFEGDSYQFCFDNGKLTSKNAY